MALEYSDGVSRDGNLVARAKRWLDSAVWRTSLYAERFRMTADGERKKLPRRVRRYVPGCPRDCLREIIEELVARAPYRDVVMDQIAEPGTVYRPSLTYYKRDYGEQQTTGGRADSSVTLIQDLVLVTEEGDTLAVSGGGNCSEATQIEFRWDETDVEDVSGASSPGRTVTVSGVHRDPDTGLVSYQIVTRTSKTRHTERFLLADDGQGRKAWRESWSNLYLVPGGSGEDEWRFCDDGGNPVDVPRPGVGEDGTLTELNVRENEDCTYDVDASETLQEEKKRGHTWTENQYREEVSDTVHGKAAAAADSPDASGGVIHDHRSELQPDGKWTVTERVETEQKVPASRKTVARTARGTRTEVTDTNVGADEVPSPSDLSGLPVGTRVTVEKTPGRLYNVTTEGMEADTGQTLSDQCAKTLYIHDHSSTEVSANPPDPVTEDHVNDVTEKNGDHGLHTSRTAELNQSDGTWDITVREVEELPVQRADVEVRRTARGTRVSVTDRNQVSPPDFIGAVWPDESDDSGDGFVRLGEAKSVKKNNGGSYDVTVSRWALPDGDVTTGAGCEKTVFEHTDTGSKTTDSPAGCVEDAGIGPDNHGHHRSARSSLDQETGLWEITERDTEELPNTSAVTVVQKRGDVLTETVTDKNMRDAADPGTDERVAGKKAYTVRNEKNPGGSWDVTVTTSTVTPSGPTGEQCDMRIDAHSHTTVSDTEEFQTGSHVPEVGYGDGQYSEKRARLDVSTGIWEITSTENTEKARSDFRGSRDPDALHTVGVTVDRHQAGNPAIGGGYGTPSQTVPTIGSPVYPILGHCFRDDEISGHHSGGEVCPFTHDAPAPNDKTALTTSEYQTNPGGSADITKTADTPVQSSWIRVIDIGRYWQKVWHFVNFTNGEVNRLLSIACQEVQGKAGTDWETVVITSTSGTAATASGQTNRVSAASVTISDSLNKYGLFSGEITGYIRRTEASWLGARVTYHLEYWFNDVTFRPAYGENNSRVLVTCLTARHFVEEAGIGIGFGLGRYVGLKPMTGSSFHPGIDSGTYSFRAMDKVVRTQKSTLLATGWDTLSKVTYTGDDYDFAFSNAGEGNGNE